MLKKIIPFILIFCLLFATAVMAEDAPMGRGNRPQGGPPEGFDPSQRPNFENGTPPEGFDPSQVPDFGNGTPPEGFDPNKAPDFGNGAPSGEVRQNKTTDNSTAAPTADVNTDNVNSKPKENAEASVTEKPDTKKPDTEKADAEKADMEKGDTKIPENQGETPADNNNPFAENGQQNNPVSNRRGNWDGNMFGQQQTAQEQPTGFKLLLQQYFTPAVSVLLLILAFVFVIFYKRKQY